MRYIILECRKCDSLITEPVASIEKAVARWPNLECVDNTDGHDWEVSYAHDRAYYHNLAQRANYQDFYHAASAILNIRLSIVRKQKNLSLEDVDYVVNKLYFYIRENPPLFEVENG